VVGASATIQLPPREDVGIVVGPSEDIGEGAVFSCRALAYAEGFLTLSGTGEALLEGYDFEVGVQIFAPGDGYENDEEIVFCGAQRLLEAHPDYESVGASISATASEIQQAHVSFQGHPAAGDGPHPTPTGRVCVLSGWVKLAS
jgi:hypothetical protein